MGAMLPEPTRAHDDASRLDALRRIALAAARPVDEGFVELLVAELAAAIGAHAAFVAVFADQSHARLRTLAMRLAGQPVENMEYAVAGSPCEEVVGREYRYIERGVLQRIDPQSDFARAGMDSYAAFPLTDSQGAALGVLAVLGTGPIADGDAAHAEVMLKIAAGRLSSELERRHTLAMMQRAALAVSAAQGESVFDELVRMLASLLGLEYAFIARTDPDDPEHLHLLALHADGCIVHDLRYALATAPCREVLGQQFRAYPSGLAQLFPDDADVLRKGAEGYAGHPLTAHDGEALGVIAVGSRRPLANLGHIEAMLKIFALRAAAEVERQRTLQALRRSEASYRAIFDSAAGGIFVHDWDSFALLDVNRRACEEHGRSREELLAIDPADLMAGDPPYDMAHALHHLMQARLDRCPPFEWKVRLADGTLRWWEMHLKPALLDGRRCILAFSNDITVRKAAEDRLRASEEQHRTIFNGSVDGLVVKDAEHRIVDVNDAYLRMHGYARGEVIGRRMSEFVPEDLQEKCEVLVPQILAGTPCHFEGRTLRRDGSQLDVELHGVQVVYGGQARVLVVMRDIAERKTAEARLRASEEQYRAMFNASADALMVWNSQLVRVDVNPAHQRIFGFTREEVVGRAFEGLPYPPELVEPRLAMVRRALAGETCRAELEAVRRDGRRITTELRAIPFRHRGEPHVLQIARDVTEQRRAEAQLRASEEQYRAIFNASADALILWDSQYRRVDVNPAYERLFGWTRDEVLGATYEHLGNEPRYMQPRQELVRRALAGESCRAELESLRKDGQTVLVEVHASPFRHRGEPHVLAIARDITERRRAERRLREREEQYRAIFDGSVDQMVLWNRRLEVVDVNTAFEHGTGMSRASVVGRRWSERPDADEMAGLLPMVEQALQGSPSHAVVKVTDGAGRLIDFEVRYGPVQIAGETHVLGIGRNVTDRIELEAQLRQAQKMEAIGQLTGGIAHDFNNILTSVLGYTAMAQERAEPLADAKLQRHLGQARLATERARDLVAQMLAFARRKPGARRPLELAPLVRQSVGLLRPTLPSSLLVDVRVDGDEAALPQVEADAVQLEQVLFNLCINARDAVAGSGHVRVGLGVADGGWRCRSCGLIAPRGRWVELSVADDGCGIDEGTMRRMFDPFFTTKPAGSGSGMGLAMVHGIVHDHGGHISVWSRPGGGARFDVLLPAYASAPGIGASPSAAEEGTPEQPAPRGRVLVVEDDEQAGGYLAEQLADWGLAVTLERDARDALARLEDLSLPLDLLLTDLTMPHLSGLALAQRATSLRPGLPVLLVSGDLGVADAQACAAAGITATLSKPVDPSALRRTLADVLARVP